MINIFLPLFQENVSAEVVASDDVSYDNHIFI